jgi:hypothetical protein
MGRGAVGQRGEQRRVQAVRLLPRGAHATPELGGGPLAELENVVFRPHFILRRVGCIAIGRSFRGVV